MNPNVIEEPRWEFFCKDWAKQVRRWRVTWVNGPDDYGEPPRFTYISFLKYRGENITLKIAHFGNN